MENPRRLLAITVGITATCAGVAYALHLVDPPGTNDWQGTVMVLFIFGACYGVIALPFVGRSILKFDHIRRDPDALARWTVPPEEWNAFVANERAWSETPNVLPNVVDVGMPVPGGGIEIVITGDAVVVGSELHRLNTIRVQRWSGPRLLSPSMALEYQITQTDPDDTYVERAIRFPVASGAERQARNVAIN